jgi:hypothetical protein
MCFSKWNVNMFKNDRFWTKKYVSLWTLTGPTSSNFSCHFFYFFRSSTSCRLKINQICKGFLTFYTGWTFCRKFGVLTENYPYKFSPTFYKECFEKWAWFGVFSMQKYTNWVYLMENNRLHEITYNFFQKFTLLSWKTYWKIGWTDFSFLSNFLKVKM